MCTLVCIDGLVQERSNSSAWAVELRLSCINPSICEHESNQLSSDYVTHKIYPFLVDEAYASTHVTNMSHAVCITMMTFISDIYPWVITFYGLSISGWYSRIYANGETDKWTTQVIPLISWLTQLSCNSIMFHLKKSKSLHCHCVLYVNDLLV